MRPAVIAVLSAVLVALAAPAAPAADRAHSAQAGGLTLTNSFVSARGWVKPGETFPLTLTVANPSASAADGGTVTVPPADGMRFSAIAGGEGARISSDGKLTWTVGSVPAGGSKRLVVEGKADTLDQ